MARRAEVENISKEYTDLKDIRSIMSQRMRHHTPSMINEHGQAKHDQQSIAKVFVTFYEQLYKDTHSSNHEDKQARDHNNHSIPPFTMQELCKA